MEKGTALAAFVALAAPLGAQQFSDQTGPSGLVYQQTGLPDHPMLRMLGGATPGDFNRDGFVDLFIPSDGTQPSRLFMNRAGTVFVEEGASYGLTGVYRGNAANAADFDGDGWMDIHVTASGDVPGPVTNGSHKLFRNIGGAAFEDVAVQAGVAWTSDAAGSLGSSWGDMDLDGDLDLFVAGWQLGAETTRLFRNEGDGTFTDVTVAAGVDSATAQSFGAIWLDQDGDRYPELHVAGDFGTSRYFRNQRNGKFRSGDWYLPAGDKVHNGMGTTIGDFDRDGDADWFVTAIFPAYGFEGPDGNRLYMNAGNHRFEPLPPSAGVDDGGWGWGAAAHDFDHDGWLDIVHTNGWETQDQVTLAEFHDDSTRLFMNDGTGLSYTDVAQAAGITHTGQGRGLVTLDAENDGDMDVVILTNNSWLQYFRNDISGPDTNWLEVKLDRAGHAGVAPHGLGSLVTISVDGQPRQNSWITGGTNYLSRSQLVAHFGLGGTTNVDVLEVFWPDGFVTRMEDVAANQVVEISAQRPYASTPLVVGETADLVVRGLGPAEAAFYLVSLDLAPSPGPCLAILGDLCLDLTGPQLLGIGISDADGTATLTVPVVDGLPITTLTSQVVVYRGPDGRHSLKSNALVLSIE
jgi:hypothetical protein